MGSSRGSWLSAWARSERPAVNGWLICSKRDAAMSTVCQRGLDLHVGPVVAEQHAAECVPAAAALEDLLEERVGRLLLAPVVEDERGLEARTKESAPGGEAVDVVLRHPVLEPRAGRGAVWTDAGGEGAGADATALDFEQQVLRLAVDDEVEGLDRRGAFFVWAVHLQPRRGGLGQQRLLCLVDGDIGDARGPQKVLEGGFVMVSSLGHEHTPRFSMHFTAEDAEKAKAIYHGDHGGHGERHWFKAGGQRRRD